MGPRLVVIGHLLTSVATDVAGKVVMGSGVDCGWPPPDVGGYGRRWLRSLVGLRGREGGSFHFESWAGFA
jgi:hypothetical protein